MEDGLEGMVVDINNVEVNVELMGGLNGWKVVGVYGGGWVVGKKREEVLVGLSSVGGVGGGFE